MCNLERGYDVEEGKGGLGYLVRLEVEAVRCAGRVGEMNDARAADGSESGGRAVVETLCSDERLFILPFIWVFVLMTMSIQIDDDVVRVVWTVRQEA